MFGRIFRYFLITLLFSSFFWNEEEKDIQQLTLEAETAIRKDDLQVAKELYRAIIKTASVSQSGAIILTWPALIDYYMKLAHIHEKLGEPEQGVQVLSELLSKQPPTSLTPKILLMKGRLCAPQSSPEKSYLLFRQIAEHLPMELWSKEDLSFFHALSYALDEYFDTQLKKAKRYFVTGFFDEAIALYEEVLSAIEHTSFPKAELNRQLLEKKIKYALAECYFSKADYEKSLSYVQSQAEAQSKIDREMLYLMALCYKHKQDYEKAILLLQDYASSSQKEKLGHYDHALFEIGFFYYNRGNYQKAAGYFQQLQTIRHNHSKVKIIGGLYLARIFLQEGQLKEAHLLLNKLALLLAESDPLKQELYFLKAETAYLQADYIKAKDAYELAAPSAAGNCWHKQAYYKLSWCYLKLATDATTAFEEKQALFDRAQQMFTHLLSTDDVNQASLSLARLYLLRNSVLNQSHALSLIQPLFDKYGTHFSLAQEHEALLLLAEAHCNHLNEKKKFLAQATQDHYATLSSYANAWFEQGLVAFQMGLKNPDNNKEDFALAIQSFEKAFHLCHKQDEKLAAKILKWEAKATLYCQSPLLSFQLLEQLLAQFIETGQEKEETLYLRGLVASRLEASYFPIVEESFKQLLENYPTGSYAPEALNILGTLYFQQANYSLAHETFLTLTTYDHPLAADGWFWAAEALAYLRPQDPAVPIYHKQVYTLYPHAPRAAEAYFRQFAYSSYYEGNLEALEHLNAFATLFPNSPMRLMVNYLLGLKATQSDQAIAILEESLKLLPRLTSEGDLPDINTIHFYYESLHKLAILYLREEQTQEKGICCLEQVLADFAEPMHPLMTCLKQQSPIPIEYAQAAYSLAKTYLDHHQRTKAEKVFLGLLSQYRESAIVDALYLSLSWREQGKLAMEDKDFETAINCLDVAEESGRASLTDEQKLKLWLLKSDCYRQIGELDKAMRLLSKVINTDIVSSLRFKAMFLRADIYELQGRPELANRQLEALVKKGGEWAEQANRRLKRSSL